MIALGCDHGGYDLMQEVKAHLEERGLEYKDYGTYSKESCDYPVFAKKVGKAIQDGVCDKGILICGTGIGISITANKMKGIRAACCSDTFTAKATREHNNANIIAFGGRVLDDSKPKYINTSDTPVYKKGNGIYALNFAKNNNDRKLILCEGYMDVIAMHQAGFTNAVAGLGTAFTPEQVSLLGRYCDELYLSFDSDEAGRKATERALSMLQKSTLKIKVLDYSGVGKDPDEVIKTQGSDRMKKVINAAVNDTEFAINRAKSKYDITTDDGRLGYINEAVDILAKIPNAVERDIYTSKIADEVSVSPDALKAQMKKAIRREEKRAEILKFEEALEHMRGSDSKVPNPERKNYPKAANAEEFILAAILKNPDLVTKKNAELKESLFITQYNRNFFNALSSRIASGRSIDINSFDGENDNGNEEVSYMAYLATMGHIVDKNPKGVEQCIQTLLAEKERLSAPQTARGMSDEEWVRAMQDKQKKKKNQNQ